MLDIYEWFFGCGRVWCPFRPHAVCYINLTLFFGLTGLRISDIAKHNGLVKLKKDGVTHEYLSGTCEKNGGKYKVPVALDERIKEILVHHCFDMNILTEQDYNKQIKHLVAELYAHHGREMLKVGIEREDVNSIVKTVYVDKNAELSTHSNRRSFISRHINSTEFNQYDILFIIGSMYLSELEKYIDIDDGSLHHKAEANSISRRQQASQRKAICLAKGQ